MVFILYGRNNGVFYEEDEDGDRSLSKPYENLRRVIEMVTNVVFVFPNSGK